MEDLIMHEIWKYLPYVDILILCQTSEKFNTFSKHNDMWIYLLKRDYDVVYVNKEGARKLYLLYREALLLFTKTFPIITSKSLHYIVNNIIYDNWQKIIDEELQQRISGYTHQILSLDVLSSIADELKIADVYTNEHFQRQLLHQYAKQVVKKGCGELLRIAYLPYIIYIDSNPTKFDYDVELIYEICVVLDGTYGVNCFNTLENIEKNLYKEYKYSQYVKVKYITPMLDTDIGHEIYTQIL